MMEIVNQILKGDQRAGARVIRLIEEEEPPGFECLKTLYPHTGNAVVIGITGPPGTGKSTIVDKMVSKYRKKDLRVGVIAIDPSSPRSGGSILGDRLRMNDHLEDPGVFIRSMASRGYQGGLSMATMGTMIIFDAMGHDVIIIETKGVGQDDVDIKTIAHSVPVVSIPGMGDHIQALKAGVLEIGDVHILNKSDHPKAEIAANDLKMMLSSSVNQYKAWDPPLIQTVARKNRGIEEFIIALEAHFKFLVDTKKIEKMNQDRSLIFFKRLTKDLVTRKVINHLRNSQKYRSLIKSVKNSQTDPFSAAENLSDRLKIQN